MNISVGKPELAVYWWTLILKIDSWDGMPEIVPFDGDFLFQVYQHYFSRGES